jgi:hypothetical protein
VNALTDKRGIALFRMKTLASMLTLEIMGMKRSGSSAYSIVKEEFGLKGNKKSVLQQLEEEYEIQFDRYKERGE